MQRTKATKTRTITKILKKTRYTDSERLEFKDLIIGKLEDAQKELHYLQDQISKASSNGTDDT